MEEGAEDAGPERQRLGRGAAAGLGSQRPLKKGVEAGPERQQMGRRGSRWAEE